MAILSGLKETLEAIDPRLWPLSIALVVWALYAAFKHFFPRKFTELPSRWKGVPGMVLAAALSGLSGPDFSSFIVETLIGALVAGGGHEFIDRAIHGSKHARVLQDLAQQKKSYP